jgi:hypothetical protein
LLSGRCRACKDFLPGSQFCHVNTFEDAPITADREAVAEQTNVPACAPRNTSWVIRIGSPLLRPGLVLESGPVSGRYVVEEARHALDLVRAINARP